MSEPLDPEDRLAEDLRTAFPSWPVPEDLADQHVAAMMAEAQLLAGEGAHAPASDPHAAGRSPSSRRASMRGRMIRRVVAVAVGLLLSFGGLAVAGAFSGGDQGDDDQAVVTDVSNDDATDAADDQGENEEADQDDDADENEDADDQGEDGDDQGEDADDQGEDADDQGEDANDDQSGSDDQSSDDQGGGDEDGGSGDGGDEQ